jgi:hypothetical protein
MAKTNATLEDHAEPTSPRAKRGRGATAAASKPVKQGRGAKNRQRGSDHATGKPSKQQLCLELLRRRDGACIEELQAATGWRAHSVRGFLSGTVKKKLGLTLSSDPTGDGPRRYRIRPEV